MTKDKKKKVITIYYDPRDYPEIEVYFLSKELEREDRSFYQANYRMRIILSEIYQILKYLGFDESIVKERYIEELGKPHMFPVVYVNGVLFSTVYNFDHNKFFEIMKKMKEIRDNYYEQLYKNIDQGFIVYPDEDFLSLRNPMYVNVIASSDDFHKARQMGLPHLSIDPFDELPLSKRFQYELEKLAVPLTNIGLSKEVKWTVWLLPERKPIEK